MMMGDLRLECANRAAAHTLPQPGIIAIRNELSSYCPLVKMYIISRCALRSNLNYLSS